jgi:hypothetical protein
MTSEGGKYGLRRDPFLGLQASTWNYDETTFAREDWPDKPKDFTSLPIELCAYTPMQAEPNIMKDPVLLPGLLEEFCLKVVPWYYKRNGDPSKAATVIIADDEVVCPALWKPRTIVAYSQTGFTGKKIRLPSNWVDVKRVQLSLLTLGGLEPGVTLPVEGGLITLRLPANRPTVISAF